MFNRIRRAIQVLLTRCQFMSEERYEATFKVSIAGLQISGPQEVRLDADLLAVEKVLDGFRVTVVITGRSEERASALATKVVGRFYERALMKYGGSVDVSTPPTLVRATFTGGSKVAAATGGGLAGAAKATTTATGTLSGQLSRQQLGDLLNDAQTFGAATGLEIAADLQAAKAMYRVAMETSDAVSCFLILYSALAMAALFKKGRVDGRGQDAVDALLKADDPNIKVESVWRSRLRKGALVDVQGQETVPTFLRNNFIHAEDRGAVPAEAIKGIEQGVSDLKGRTGRILGGM